MTTMSIDLRGSYIFNDCGKDVIVELGRLTYKHGGVCVYLPKIICNALHLNPTIDNTLVIATFDDNSFILIKDVEVANLLKPKIMETRRLLFQKPKPENGV